MPDDEYAKVKGPDGTLNYFDNPDSLATVDTSLGPPKRKEPAMARIRAFGARRGRSFFPQITRESLFVALSERVIDPDGVNQKTTGLCGVVVIVRLWAYEFPEEFAKFAIDLFEKGEAVMRGDNTTHTRQIRPSTTLRDAAPPPGLNRADWIVSASIRESLNKIFKHYNPLGDTLHSISCTWPGDLKRQFSALGYTNLRGRFTPGKTQGYESLMEASRLFRAHWRVVLLINHCLLENETTFLVHYPDHYVGLTSPITPRISTGEPTLYPFNVWSYAANDTLISDRGGPIALETVRKNYFGFVAGKF
jgi:hypothetical protein